MTGGMEARDTVAAVLFHQNAAVVFGAPKKDARWDDPEWTWIRQQALDAADAVLAALDLPALLAEARADALNEAADAWQQGQWADAPRRADRVQERLANAQHVTDWLRARVDAANNQEPT